MRQYLYILLMIIYCVLLVVLVVWDPKTEKQKRTEKILALASVAILALQMIYELFSWLFRD
ncbi:hypothetical protein LJC47_02885 [Desulfosarcina sp. OttesenSCG-928-B08]|nr:hypothetical protein [Desulfosarcina sp. OttesenSCG-928-B08]